MKKTLIAAAATASLLLSAAQSNASMSIGTWASTPGGVTAAGVTWELISHDLPASWNVDFNTQTGGFVIQSAFQGAAPLTGSSVYHLVYTATAASGKFTGVKVDSTAFGPTSVTKNVYSYDGSDFLATATSSSGDPSAWQDFDYHTSAIKVYEIISPNNGNIISFSNTYEVPEPSTYMAGCLLLLPFAASAMRFARKNRQS